MRRIVLSALSLALLAGVTPASAARRPPKDRKAPVVRTYYYDKTIVISSNTSASGTSFSSYSSQITGTVTDNLSGVASMAISYSTCEAADMNNAKATCTRGTWGTNSPCKGSCAGKVTLQCNKTRRSCYWWGYPPVYPGTYLVVASARDKSKNLGRMAPFRIIVL